MKFRKLHRWDLTPREAIALQKKLVARLDLTRPLRGPIELVAGADASYNRFSSIICASVVVWRPATDEIVETADAVLQTRFPYVPGLLSFREAPALLAAFALLRTTPDVVLVDGQGYAHPRRMGIASHVGLWLQLPTVGCAKTRLCGEYKEPRASRGSTSALTHNGEVVGRMVRTKRGARPLFLSCGNVIDVESAVRIVLATTRGRRLPVPSLLAHAASNSLRRQQPS
jgi:deoxyribonuclease V